MFVCSVRRDHQSGPAGFTFTETEDDDSEFRLVDKSSHKRIATRGYRARGGNRPGGNFRPYTSNFPAQRNNQGNVRGGRQPYGRGGFQQRGGRGHQGGFRQQHHYGGFRSRMGDSRRFDASINVNPEWGDPIEIFEFSKLTKIAETVYFPGDEQEVLLEAGKVGVYNADFGRTISAKNPRTLVRTYAQEKIFLKVTTSEDPNLKKFASQGTGDVFLTDSILSAILAMPRALYSWDLVITKVDGKIWIDRRTSRFDAITVNENATDPPDNNETDPLNTPQRLSQEAIACQQNFSQQVLTKDAFHSLPYTSPFASGADSANHAPVGYRYVSVPLGNRTVVVRSEFDAVKKTASGVQPVLVKTLNEYDAKVTGDWRKRIEVQRGGVLATELKNNMFKIQRWAIQAIFAGVSTIDIGFLSRQQAKDASAHHILSVQSYSPQEFFTGMNVNLNQMWSILNLLIERVSAEEDGKYLMYKEAGVPNLKLFKVPNSSSVVEPAAEASSASSGLQVLK